MCEVQLMWWKGMGTKIDARIIGLVSVWYVGVVGSI